MNKLLSIVVFIILFCIVGLATYKLLDLDKTLQLPFSQGVNATEETGKDSSPISHIVIIMMENKGSQDILENPQAPFINSQVQKYSSFDNYFAVSHPSLPNYLSVIGGDTFGIGSDCIDCYIASPNLIDQLEKTHKTWKAYMEDMPTDCFVGNSGNYAQKHDPFIYFDNIRNNPDRCQKIVPFSQLQTDLQSVNTLPNFIWITPNLCHDMHNCDISVGDSWLANTVPLLLHSPAFTKQKSLLIITWDEAEGSGKNKIPTIFIGNTVKKGYISHTLYSHYSLTHTIENLWNMDIITNNVGTSTIIQDVFSTQ